MEGGQSKLFILCGSFFGRVSLLSCPFLTLTISCFLLLRRDFFYPLHFFSSSLLHFVDRATICTLACTLDTCSIYMCRILVRLGNQNERSGRLGRLIYVLDITRAKQSRCNAMPALSAYFFLACAYVRLICDLLIWLRESLYSGSQGWNISKECQKE